MIEKELYLKAENTVKLLKEKNLTVATAESCTGGMLASYITSVSGVSDIFEMGVTSYSCRIKNKLLGVENKTLEKFGAVSKETATEMAVNVRSLANSDIGVSVTGAAGPSGTEGHPAGYVFTALPAENTLKVELLNIEPKSRNFVREKAVSAVFSLIEQYIKEQSND